MPPKRKATHESKAATKKAKGRERSPSTDGDEDKTMSKPKRAAPVTSTPAAVQDSTEKSRSINRQYTFKLNEELGVLEANKVKPSYPFSWKGRSDYGVRTWESKRKGKVGTVIRFKDCKDTNSIKEYLEEIDSCSADFTEGVLGKKKILEELGTDPDAEVEIIYNGGWKDYVIKHPDWKDKPVEVDVYPGQYTILGEFKGRPIPRKETPFSSMVEKSANSDWTLKSVINKFNYSYNDNAKILEVTPYVNINLAMWVNVGQQTVLDPDQLKKIKEQDEAAQWDDLAAIAADLASKSSK